MKYDNDNQPRTADSFSTPQERHAYIASRPDTRMRPAGAVPLATRLARAGRVEDLQRLIDHGMQRWPASWLEANGNLPEGGKLRLEDDDLGADCVLEMRPSPRELKAAGKDGIRRNAKGHIIEWRGSDGKWRQPAELWRHSKGGRRRSADEVTIDAARHLILRGVGSLPKATPRNSTPSEGDEVRRLRAIYWVEAMGAVNDIRRTELNSLGIGARVPFAQARVNAGLPPAERGPAALAWRMDWLGQQIRGNPKATQAGVEGGHSTVEDATIAGIDNPRIDAALGEHALALDDSLFGLTAREIAAKRGWGNSKASEERAVRAQDWALAALEKIAA